jgi:hypothetical protein
MTSEFNRRLFIALLAGLASAGPTAAFAAQATTSSAGAAEDILSSVLLEPRELVRMLRSTREKPRILQVGVPVLYAQAHVAGAEYVGAADTPAGLDALRRRLANAPVASEG